VAALIEGLVTPSPLSTTARIAVGVLACAGFWIWVLALGRSTAMLGGTGRFNDVLASR
jgi:hypothetical protein